MASSGKKGKKSKGKTLALTDFLQETPGATSTQPIRKTLNWAEEVEDVYDQYESRPKPNVVLPTAPKASRGVDDFSDKIPNQPPYIAYLSNLPYDVNEQEIAEFFGNLKITSMRIPKEDRATETPRLRGFGYVEFEDRESLVGALSITDCTLKTRRIRIEVATNLENDRRRGGRMDGNRDRPDRSETTSGDWRSGPRAEPEASERRGGGGGGGGGGGFSRDRERDAGPIERDRPGSWRDNSDRPSFRDNDRDRGFSRDSDRGSSYRDGPRDGFGDRNRFGDRDGDRKGFGDRDGDRKGFGDRDGDRKGFGPRRNDREEREGGFQRGAPRDDMGSDKSEFRIRTKLVLTPRTKPIDSAPPPPAPEKEAEVQTRPAAAPVPAASIFGNAKPVDTSARERQIEERLAKESEKPAVDSGREEKKEEDRRDWGRKKNDDGRVSPRRGSNDRKRSPRRGSPPHRRTSPRRSSPKRTSPRRTSPRRHSPRRSSPRRNSPRRNSPRRDSPGTSPKRRSPRRYSPRRNSPRRYSPKRNSPDRKGISPERKEISRGPPAHLKNDEKGGKGPFKNDRPFAKDKNDKEKPKREDKPHSRDTHDKELPKLKEPEPPNFAANNKYAFLQDVDDISE